jgi:hypothetical protein
VSCFLAAFAGGLGLVVDDAALLGEGAAREVGAKAPGSMTVTEIPSAPDMPSSAAFDATW